MNSINSTKIDYVIIASDDNPMYKDFYDIVAKQWFDLGFKTYYVNITNEDKIVESKYGIIHKIKALDCVPTSFQSQVVRLFASTFIDGNILMSDVDMLPINKDYFISYISELNTDNVIVYSGQPYGAVPYYPMCYVLANSLTFKKYLNLENISFLNYCNMLNSKYGQAWNTDEHFMYDMFEMHKNNLIIKTDRDFQRRIDRGNWNYDIVLLNKGYYIDSHLPRPYSDYKAEIDELINLIK